MRKSVKRVKSSSRRDFLKEITAISVAGIAINDGRIVRRSCDCQPEGGRRGDGMASRRESL